MQRKNISQQLNKVSAEKELIEGQSDELATREAAAYKKEQLAHEANLNNQNLGWLGKLFGAKANAVTNIAGLSALLAGLISIVCVIFALYLLSTDKQNVKELIAFPSSMATLALGYLFGKSGK